MLDRTRRRTSRQNLILELENAKHFELFDSKNLLERILDLPVEAAFSIPSEILHRL